METVITATKTELIEAMNSYNLAILENPDGYGEIENTKECAKIQVENLIEHLVKIRS